MRKLVYLGTWLTLCGFVGLTAVCAEDKLPALEERAVKSSLDQTDQPYRIWVPESALEQPTPVLVYLHSWSGDFRQDNSVWLKEAVDRGWIFVHPNFRGVNQQPQACGSKFARQDVIDTLDSVMGRFKVDPERVYLAGSSGGGHMAMLLAANYPDRFSAVSAWVGISDIAAWYEFHKDPDNPAAYGRMVLKCLGGPPGTSPEIDADYRDRSPLTKLAHAKDVPLDIAAGIHDGYTGSVPISHSLLAFNVLAKANGTPLLTETEMAELGKQEKLSHPQKSDLAEDPGYGRAIYLRRYTGPSRVTIFEGGHESLPGPACAWLATQKKMTKPPAKAK